VEDSLCFCPKIKFQSQKKFQFHPKKIKKISKKNAAQKKTAGSFRCFASLDRRKKILKKIKNFS
jgi:hypothetical protein